MSPRLPLIFYPLLLSSVVVSLAAREDVEVSCLFKNRCVLPCYIKGLSEITWTKERMPVQWYPRDQSHHQHIRYRNRTELFDNEIPKGNCSLLVKDVQPEDNGIYECYTKNGRNNWSFYNIRVHAPVEMVNIVQSGGFLICSSERVYPKPDLRWFQSSIPLSNLSHLSLKVHQDDQHLYSINSTLPLEHNNSQYSCNVSTPHGWRSAYYTQLSPITIYGTETMLPCATSTAPVKSLVWKFNNTQTILNQSSEDQRFEVSESWRPFVKNISESDNLMLKGLTSDQQGLFTCHLRTDKETFTFSMWLEIQVFSSLVVGVVITAALLLTVLALCFYKWGQNTSEAQPSNSEPSLPQRPPSGPPQDKYYAVRVMCVILGLGSVLPWHFFVTASLYFKHRMETVDQTWTISVIALVSQLSQLLHEVLSSRCHLRFSQQKHTIGCLTMIMLLFASMTVFVKVQMAGGNFFCISMCVLWLSSLLSAMVQCNLCDVVSLLPSKYRGSFTHSQAVAGILASVIMIFFVAITKDFDSAVFYHFLFASVGALVALLSYLLLPRMGFAKHHFSLQHKGKEDCTELLDINDQMNNNTQEHAHSSVSQWPNRIPDFLIGFCVMLVPTITLSVYPAITADVQTVYPGKWEPFFIPVGCFLIFNIFDWIGQIMPPKLFCAGKHFQILFRVLVVIRIAFIPLFMFCNVQRRNVLHVDSFLSNDAVFIIFIALFSFSNSFLWCLAIRERDSDTPSIIWGPLGSTFGAALSFAIRTMI